MSDPRSFDPRPVLDHWFGTDADPRPIPERWFAGTPEDDAEIRARFAEVHAAAHAGALDGWAHTPDGAIARVVVLDQFPRHLFRGDPRMFASDPAALAAARDALRHRDRLAAAHLAAIWLALTHPEDPGVVAEAVAGFAALVQSPLSRAHRKLYRSMARSARSHLRILERFGRYPHRNTLLGRETTDEEAAYLAADTSRFARSVRPHPVARRLRILVLHSFRQSGRRLASRMRRVEAALEDIAELVYVDAPHPYVADAEEHRLLVEDFGEPPDFAHQRCWWNADAEHRVYDGWEASMRLLEAHLPADGVIGFSQGGAAAGLFAALHGRALRFAICISGFPSRADAHRHLCVPGSVDLPSLHVYGEQDALMNRERTLALAGCFVDPVILAHRGGHFFPELWPVDAMRAFLLAFLDPAVRASAAAEGDAEGFTASDDPSALAARFVAIPDDRRAAALVELRRSLASGGDLPHRIWLAAWQVDPDAVRTALAAADDWAAHARLAVRASLDLVDPDPVLDAIAARFAARIAEDEAAGALSLAAERAPRTGSAVDKLTGLGRRIARLLEPGLADAAAYARYRRRIVAQSEKVRALRRRTHAAREAVSPSPPTVIPSEVLRPRPVPVVPCPADELAPLLAFLGTGEAPVVARTFPRGTVLPDGRLDLCKQVVGPDGIGPLLGALADNAHVDRVLLGNNVVGDDGAARIASFLRSGRSRVRVWYIAGNEIDARGLDPLCDALRHAPEVNGLWLKRNPVGPDGAAPIAELLRADPPIETLDLVNTGLLDEGALRVIDALASNHHLRHLYLGTNGLGPAVAEPLARYLADHDRLVSLYVDCNRLGDEGALVLADGLRRSRHLRRLSLASNRIGPAGARALADALGGHPSLAFLNLGWTRATNAVHEDGNRIGDEGCAALADMLRRDAVSPGPAGLRALDVSHNAVSQRGLDHLRDALEVNTTLVHLRHPQYGKAANPDSVATLRGRVERNRRAAGLDVDAVEAIRTPRPTREVLSVYRTGPMP